MYAIRRLLTALLMLLCTGRLAALELGGASLADVAKHSDGTALVLNGAGIRTKFGFVNIYAAGFYLPAKSTNADAIVGARQASRMLLVLLRTVDTESLLKAFHEALAENVSAQSLAALRPSVDTLDNIFRQIMPHENDRLVLDIEADGGLRVFHNDQKKGSVAGPDIGPAMLQIWLGRAPVQKSLKADLLGES